jgi:hypothetical protein
VSDFPAIPEGWAYLDTAATAQKPRPVIDAITRGYAETYATVHRGVYQRSADMTLAFEAARRRTAAFINARVPEEVVFVRGATEAINLVAQSWGGTFLKAGDRILLSMLEHHSNIVPWQMVADRVGAIIDVAPLTADGQIDLDAMAAMLTPQHKARGPGPYLQRARLRPRCAPRGRTGPCGGREDPARWLPGGARACRWTSRPWAATSTSFPPTSFTARPASACCGAAATCSMPCRPCTAAGP